MADKFRGLRKTLRQQKVHEPGRKQMKEDQAAAGQLRDFGVTSTPITQQQFERISDDQKNQQLLDAVHDTASRREQARSASQDKVARARQTARLTSKYPQVIGSRSVRPVQQLPITLDQLKVTAIKPQNSQGEQDVDADIIIAPQGDAQYLAMTQALKRLKMFKKKPTKKPATGKAVAGRSDIEDTLQVQR